MARTANTGEGGSQGTTVSTSNSGGSSGTAFDAVVIGAAGALTFDNAHAQHGTYSYKIVGVASAVYAAWQSATLGSHKMMFYRFYSYMTAAPLVDSVVMSFYGSGSLRCKLVSLSGSSGDLRWVDANGATMTTATTAAYNVWSRVEGCVYGDASVGQAEILLQTSTPDSLTFNNSNRSTAAWNTGGAIDEVRWGDITGIASTYWLDDVGVSDVGYLGPSNLTFTDPVPNTAQWGDTPTFTAKTYSAPDL